MKSFERAGFAAVVGILRRLALAAASQRRVRKGLGHPCGQGK
jgi:hypothetical protein